MCLLLSFFVFFTVYFDLPRFLPSLTIIENIPTTNDDLTMMKRKEPGSCGKLSVMGTQQTRNICITFVQCWTNVEDVGPALYTCYTNVLCLLGNVAPALDLLVVYLTCLH